MKKAEIVLLAKRPDRLIHRRIGSVVVDHQHFVGGAFQAEQAPKGLNDKLGRLAVGGYLN